MGRTTSPSSGSSSFTVVAADLLVLTVWASLCFSRLNFFMSRASSAGLTFACFFKLIILAAKAAKLLEDSLDLVCCCCNGDFVGLFKLILIGFTVALGGGPALLEICCSRLVAVAVAVLGFISFPPILSLSFGNRGWSDDCSDEAPAPVGVL